MTPHQETSAAARPQQAADDVREADLERVLEAVPRGAFVLCGLAVAILVACWLAVYIGIFLPRGPIH